MKYFIKSKPVIAIFFFIIGVAITSAYWKQKPFRNMHTEAQFGPSFNSSFFDGLFNDDFFGKSKNPFAEMQRMQRQMLKEFNEPDVFQNSFNNWYKNKFGGGNIYELTQREDENFIYYEIQLEGLHPQKVDVDVKDGQVFISGSAEATTKDSLVESTFQRSFPVPPNVDANKLTMEQQESKMIIKFPKL